MARRTLPLLFFNLGGEMVYILHQRLHAQNVLTAKANKVMQDMVMAMFNEQCIEEMFRPQNLFSSTGLKALFLSVAHSSIMRLNDVAMEKLYDLMSMGFKYQLVVCPRPEDVILITLNHLDTIKKLVSDSEQCCDMVQAACRKVNEHYSPLSKAEFIALRATMLSLLQDSHKRISVLLRQGLQRKNGVFVLPVGGPVPIGFEIQGAIRYYSEEGDVVVTDQFSPTHLYTPAGRQGSWEVTGDRATRLGCNIYTLDVASSSSRRKRSSAIEGVHPRPGKGEESGVRVQKPEEFEDTASGSLATVELTLLHRLLARQQVERDTQFKLNLFPELELEEGESDSSEDTATGGGESNKDSSVIRVDPLQRGADEFTKIRDELTIADAGSSSDDDCLTLMDQATA